MKGLDLFKKKKPDLYPSPPVVPPSPYAAIATFCHCRGNHQAALQAFPQELTYASRSYQSHNANYGWCCEIKLTRQGPDVEEELVALAREMDCDWAEVREYNSASDKRIYKR